MKVNDELAFARLKASIDNDDDYSFDDICNKYENETKQTLTNTIRAILENPTNVTELNRYGKETGKATGSLNKRAGTPVKTGGTSSPVMRAVRSSIRRETGKPEGQQKKERGKKPPVAGEYGARRSPAQIIAKRRQQKADADAAMRDTRGT